MTIEEMREAIRVEAEIIDPDALVTMYQSWFGGKWEYDDETDTATNTEDDPADNLRPFNLMGK